MYLKCRGNFYHNAFVSIMNRTQNLKSCSEAVRVWHSHSRWRQRLKETNKLFDGVEKYYGIDMEYMFLEVLLVWT
jgi:alpha-glucuronidase